MSPAVSPASLLRAAASPVRLLLARPWEQAEAGVRRLVRLVDTGELVLDELLVAVRDARRLLRRIDEAVEGGVLDELARVVTRLDEVVDTVERLARDAEARLPTLEVLAETQADVEGARMATERLVSLVDATLLQLDSLPGAGLVRRRISRVAATEDQPGADRPADPTS